MTTSNKTEVELILDAVEVLKGEIWDSIQFVHTRINKFNTKATEQDKAIRMLSEWIKNVEKKNQSLKRLLKDKYNGS